MNTLARLYRFGGAALIVFGAGCGSGGGSASVGSPSAGFISVLKASSSGCVDVKSPRGPSVTGQPVFYVSAGAPFVVQLSEEFCNPGARFSSLPQSYSLFRALAAGRADIVAPLAAGWSQPAGGPPLSDYRVTVEVSP
jgi:hypothetical protein